jgi:hypothetical protein
MAAVLTAFTYPFFFSLAGDLNMNHPLFAATILAAVRNITLTGGTVAWLWAEARSGGRGNSALPATRLALP